MTKKELREKIAKQQKKEALYHKTGIAKANLRELYNYIEVGDNDTLREKALHAIKHVVTWIKGIDKNYSIPRAWVL